MKGIAGLLAILVLLLACTPSNQQSQLEFEDAWVRAMPPGSKMTAGFGRLVNTGTDDLSIAGWASDSFGVVSLHRTVTENGVSRMRSIPELTLSPGSERVLEPGGYHLMFMQPVEGDRQVVRLNVELSDGSQYVFDLPVERR